MESFAGLRTNIPFEIVIIEDGSQKTSEAVINSYKDRLNIFYLKKENTGPGDSRNFGMERANGDYFIILDSDCLLPPQYLDVVSENLNQHFVDCYGGPDAAHPSFSKLQRGINFAMTSVISTGGVRGGKGAGSNFQPRSFNMGLSKKAFEATGGFGNIHPGEDPDLSIRLRKHGFETILIPEAFVYHKRRINWSKFFKQVYKFGKVRPILNLWHPQYAKITFWFPTIFLITLTISVILALFGNPWALSIFAFYFLLVFLFCLFKERNIWVAIFAVIAVLVQFVGYGIGYLQSFISINVQKKKAEKIYPELFFNK